MAEQTYVDSQAWVRQIGRPDLIDEVADQFERPAVRGRESFWSLHADARWPRAARGWRSPERLHPRALERRAG